MGILYSRGKRKERRSRELLPLSTQSQYHPAAGSVLWEPASVSPMPFWGGGSWGGETAYMSIQTRPEVGNPVLPNLQMVRPKSSVTKQQMKPEMTHFQPLLLPDLFILLLFIGSDYYHQRHCGLNHFSSGSLDVTHNTIFIRKKKSAGKCDSS